ncbi:MAG: ABC transporter permease [Bacteroidales bacterium]|nr:ABC transporter permease [Bacteroidales bacterium]
MIKNYILTAIRNLKRHTTYSFINIIGLAIGMACSILILLWVQDELKFDKWHSKKDRIERVLVSIINNGEPYRVAVTPAALAPNMQKDFPEIELMCRFKNWGPWLFKYKDGEYIQAGSAAIDSTAFNIFDFKFISGNPKNALTDAHSVVLTEKVSKRIFGEENPVGKIIEVRERGAFKITGVIEYVDHSHFDFDFLFPFHLLREDGEDIDEMDQGPYNFTTYFLLKNKNLSEKVNDKLNRYLDKFDEENDTELFSQSLNDIYLKSDFAYDFTIRGDLNNVITFSLIAFLVLLIACINFMNLTTARSSNRAKEIGLRKVVGAKRKNVISQFFCESIFMSLLSFVIALVLVALLLPKFNELSGKELSAGLISDPYILTMLIVIAVITGLIAGSYPALYLSAFNPIKVLKGKLSSGAKSSGLRRTLVVIQFTLSVALIISTILIAKQIKYINNKDLGYNKHHLIYLGMENNTRQNYKSIKQQLLQNPNIKGVTTSRVLPVYACPSMTLEEWEGKSDDRTMSLHYFPVGFDFFETMQISMAEGRAFSEYLSSDTINSFIVNEEAVRQMGMENPIGKTITLDEEPGYIVGVMKDFNFNNIKNKIAPLMLYIDPNQANICFIRVGTNDIQKTLDYIQDIWKSFEPDYEFNYRFMDETLENLYRAEQRSNTLINYFSIFAIFISCLGIFGLASFMAEQKTKEIGIRKVLGASVPTIVRMFSAEFTKLIIIGNILAWPIAYYAMNRWLENFAYHTELSLWMFVLGAVLSIAVVIITISYQSYKAAIRNPAESLRNE